MAGIFTCRRGNRGVERRANKCQHTMLTLEKKLLPPLLPGFELETFRLRVRRSYQQAIPALLTRLLSRLTQSFLTRVTYTVIADSCYNVNRTTAAQISFSQLSGLLAQQPQSYITCVCVRTGLIAQHPQSSPVIPLLTGLFLNIHSHVL